MGTCLCWRSTLYIVIPIIPKLQVLSIQIVFYTKKKKLTTYSIMPRFAITQVGSNELEIEKVNWHAPNSFRDPNVGPKLKHWGKKKLGRPLHLQYFGCRRTCWSFGMGLGWTHKWELKMKSTCTTKKRGWLMQVEWKWCNGLSKDNFKHKFYMVCNLWKEAPLPSL
jgi:hypothetical protein